MPTTHSSKAKSFDIGRPEYPSEFFDRLYNEFELNNSAVIADIGSGTGKVARHFLERGNKVFAIEYDADMLNISNKNLHHFPNYIPICTIAENTQLEPNSIDLIFCGNSYCWFDRAKTIPEFLRISHKDAIVIIAYLGGAGLNNPLSTAINEMRKKYFPPSPPVFNLSPAFPEGNYTSHEIKWTIYDNKEKFMHASLSQSGAPSESDEFYKTFCNEMETVFDIHSVNGIIAAPLRLRYDIGKVCDLLS